MDDRRLGSAIRAIRRQRGWRQVDLAAAAGVSQTTISEVELGRLDDVVVRTLRAILKALDARLDLNAVWRGAHLDRLLDRRHAAIVETVARVLVEHGWDIRAEASFALLGERGSIDLLVFHPPTGTLLLIEVKSEFAGVEETLRRISVKRRVAPTVARNDFGWSVRRLAVLLVLPDSGANRRQVAAHSATFDSSLPDWGLRVRDWLRRPDRAIAGVWFLSQDAVAAASRRPTPPHRVTRPRARSG